MTGGPLSQLVTLDDLNARAAAASDPQGFIAGLGDGAVIDEVQRVPELVLAVKASVDRDRRPGRFLLTGSANPFHQQEETLAGRREDVSLWTLSQAELEDRSGDIIDASLLMNPRRSSMQSRRPTPPMSSSGRFAVDIPRCSVERSSPE